MTDRRTFRGSVVASIFTSGLPWERLTLSEDTIEIKPWLREATIVERSEVASVQFLRIRWPLVWRTMIRVRLRGGQFGARTFVPWRASEVRRACDRLGWPTTELHWSER